MNLNEIPSNAQVLVSLSDLKEFALGLINKSQVSDHKEEKAKFLSPEEAATKLKVSRVSLWRWEKAGYLTANRIGGKVYYKESDITKLMEG